MPGHVHGLIQVKFSILVKDGVRAGREGEKEVGGSWHASGPLPIQTTVSWEQDWLWWDAPPPTPTPDLKLKPCQGSLTDTQALVSTLPASLRGIRVPPPCSCPPLQNEVVGPVNHAH